MTYSRFIEASVILASFGLFSLVALTTLYGFGHHQETQLERTYAE